MEITLQIIIALTGLIGVVSGTVISYLSLRHASKNDRYRIRIKLQESMLAWPQPGSSKAKLQKGQLTFNIANIGHRSFKVVSLGLEIGKRSGGIYINDPIGTVKTPYELAPGETCAFWSDYKSIKSSITKPKLRNAVKIRAYVSDYLGNNFKSNVITVRFKESPFRKIINSTKHRANRLLSVLFP